MTTISLTAPRHPGPKPFVEWLKFPAQWGKNRILIVVLLSAHTFAIPCHAGDFEVTTMSDTEADDGRLSLREAVLLANGSPGSHLITFAPSIAGNLQISNTFPPMTGDIRIEGPGPDNLVIQAIDNPAGNRPVDIRDGAVVTLIGLGISSGTAFNPNTVGDTGGGIRNQGTLTLRHCRVSGHQARLKGGGIFNSGYLEIVDSEVSDNVSLGDGGGIHNDGTLVLTNSAVVANETRLYDELGGNNIRGNGGGVSNSGTLIATGSIFDGNKESELGAGIFNFGTMSLDACTISNNANWVGTTLFGSIFGGRGGGIASFGGSTLNRCTLSGNLSLGAGAAIYNLSNLEMRDCTVSSNTNFYLNSQFSGIVHNADSGFLTLQNNIIGGNRELVPGAMLGEYVERAATADLTNYDTTMTPPIISLGHNLVSTGEVAAFFGNTGDQFGEDPMLKPLADNGGPTKTHEPFRGSPVIDAGFSDSEEDQQGFARNQGGAVDIGAMESDYFEGPDFVVNSLGDSERCDARICTLRGALTIARGFAGASDITFADGLAGDIVIKSELPPVAGEISIMGPADGEVVVRREEGLPFRLLSVNPGGHATISDLDFAGGDAESGDGGGILNEGQLSLTRCDFDGNSASNGGGVANDGGIMQVKESTFAGNQAETGGGIFNLHGNLRVNRSSFVNNRATYAGAGIASFVLEEGLTSETLVTNSTFSGNETNSPEPSGFNFNGGAGVYNLTTAASDAASLHVINSTFSANLAINGQGGGVMNFSADMVVDNSLLVGNATSLTASATTSANAAAQLDSAYPFTGRSNLVGLPNGLALSDIIGPLGYHGGPTPTFLPAAGSPVIGAGDTSLLPFTLFFDQRGYPRVTGGALEQGAVEAVPGYEIIPAVVSFDVVEARIHIATLLSAITGGIGLPPVLVSVHPPGNPDSDTGINGEEIFYRPAPGQTSPDSFTYTVTDGIQQFSGVIQMEYVPLPANGFAIESIEPGDDQITIHARGIAGRRFQLEKNATLEDEFWSPVGDAILCEESGLMTFPDTTPPPPSTFYRLRIVP